ncbi:unnamed protein product [Ilex paraguariensis]|uniref:Uncharacterized protein n=1 Tax=Ilex paraguariensis TaxID=185542 RepID=A0ABC8RM51_9AQUA
MMNAFLEHGIPESPELVVALMQKNQFRRYIEWSRQFNGVVSAVFLLHYCEGFEDRCWDDARVMLCIGDACCLCILKATKCLPEFV